MRRIFDVTLAAVLIVVTLPVWLLIAFAILIFSPGAIFYGHRRLGRQGRPFTLWKFRTMHPQSAGGSLTISGDSRITGVGRVLRRWKLDELPQLINILAGDMTFVGPRPETEDFVVRYDAAQAEILKFTPGLTDPASLKYRHEQELLASYDDPVAAYLDEILPDKISLSLQYQQHRSLTSDLKIAWQTILAIFQKREVS
jgi:lipopolysaccharide/colanic/teichoic acid biosynthesis glycosyltransferase